MPIGSLQFETDKIKWLQAHSLDFFIDFAKRSLRKYKITHLLGTKTHPVFSYPADIFAPFGHIAHSNREEEADDLLTYLFEMTAGPIQNCVREYTENKDGVAALCAIILHVNSLGATEQSEIRDYFASKHHRIPDKGDPTGFIRKIEILVSVYNSYGRESTYSNQDERDILRDSLRNSTIYKSLREWCTNNLEAFEGLTSDELRDKILVNYFEHLKQNGDRSQMPSSNKSMDVDEPTVPEGKPPGNHKGKGLAVSEVTDLNQLSKRQRSNLQSLFNEQSEKSRQNNPNYKGGKKRKFNNSHASWSGPWCNFCKAATHWKPHCWNNPDGEHAAKGGKAGGKGTKGKGGKSGEKGGKGGGKSHQHFE